MATLFVRGNNYYLQWTDLATGKQRKKSLKTSSKNKAKSLKIAKEFELLSGGSVPIDKNVTFFQFSSEYKLWRDEEFPASKLRANQIIDQHLMPVFGRMVLKDINVRDVELFKSMRRKKVKSETVNKELRQLRAVINRAVKLNILVKNPFKSVENIKVTDSRPIRWFTVDELKKIYAVDPLHAETWMIMANTGARRGEMLNLKWDNVHDNHIDLISIGEERTKSGKWRKVPLSPGAKVGLELLRDSGDGIYVIPKCRPESLTRAFKKALGRAGLDGYLHCLRHTFCSHLVMQGKSLRTVQLLAGHENQSTTEKYAHLSNDYLAASVDGLSL